MTDSTAMTVDFLRARLLSERSVSRTAKERADQLATRVAELEEQVRAVTAQRRQAERAAAEVLAILESQGFDGHLSDVLDSGSDHDGEEEEPRDGDAARRSHRDDEQEPAPAQGEADEALSGTARPGGLSWKGRSVSPRKARQLKQKHRRSYFYFLASDSSPKYRMGQSCRKNKRKELSNGRSAAPEEEGGGVAVLAESRKGQQDGSDCTDDGQSGLDGEVGGDERSSGDGGGGGQYVIRYEKDAEMERVLERQAELIGQYEAEEKAQREWEKKFNESRSSSKGDVEAANKAYQLETGRDQSNRRAKLADLEGTEEHTSSQQREAGEQHGHGCAQAAAVSPRGSSSHSTVTGQVQNQGDENSDGCSSYNTSGARSSRHIAIRAPSDGSPSSDTLNSKVSDWSSSHFHDLADNQLDTPSYRQSSNITDVGGVLEALQRAKMSLRAKLCRPVPPSQVMLALPAPGDEYRADEDSPVNGCNDSYREEPSNSSPARQEILALPAPEDYHHHDHGRVDFPVNGAGNSLTEKLGSSSPPHEEILALPGPGDDYSGEVEEEIKIPIGTSGLFRLPTDSFPKNEMISASGRNANAYDSGFSSRETARENALSSHRAAHGTVAPSVHGGDPGFPATAKQYCAPHSSVLLSVPTSGRCSIPGSDFTVGGTSFLPGIPGLGEDFRRGRKPLGDANLFMQRGCDYTISNKWML